MPCVLSAHMGGCNALCGLDGDQLVPLMPPVRMHLRRGSVVVVLSFGFESCWSLFVLWFDPCLAHALC